jgi:hypothetical protein
MALYHLIKTNLIIMSTYSFFIEYFINFIFIKISE